MMKFCGDGGARCFNTGLQPEWSDFNKEGRDDYPFRAAGMNPAPTMHCHPIVGAGFIPARKALNV